MLKRFKEQQEGKRLPCTISTFGFGYDLDSALLSQLAIDGSGSYSFIPDAGFVGTVFVNAMANILVTMAKDVTLKLKPMGGASFSTTQAVLGGFPSVPAEGNGLHMDLGSLSFGQAKSIVVQMQVPASAQSAGYLQVEIDYCTRGRIELATATCTGKGPSQALAIEPHIVRLSFVDFIRNAMRLLTPTAVERAAGGPLALDRAKALTEAMVAQICSSPACSQEAVKALNEDLNGQVAEALSREDWYKKWGLHYLPSLMCAHLTQQCNNFKDAGVQHYGGQLFESIRDAADEIFLALPAPQGRAAQAAPAAPAPRTSLHSVNSLASAASLVSEQPINMQAYHNRFAGCFHANSMVRMHDGTEKRARDVQKGDMVASPPSNRGGGGFRVECVVRTLASSGSALLAELPGGLRITPYHPICHMENWCFPADHPAAKVSEMPCDAVCTFLLENGGTSVIINGVPCLCLGHELTESSVTSHPFFGSRAAILAAFEKVASFQREGLVEIPTAGNWSRDPFTGLVSGFTQ